MILSDSCSSVPVCDSKGMTHEFQANPDDAKDMKPGDRVEAKLRRHVEIAGQRCRPDKLHAFSTCRQIANKCRNP